MKKIRKKELCRRGLALFLSMTMLFGMSHIVLAEENVNNEMENSASAVKEAISDGNDFNIEVIATNLDSVGNDAGISDSESPFDITKTERPEQTAGIIVAPGAPELEEDSENASNATSTTDPATGDSAENIGSDDTSDLTQTETSVAPEYSDSQTDQADTDNTDVPEKPVIPENPNWDIFYDATSDIYKLTFTIPENAEGDQTIDLTYALELLGEYARTAEKPSEPVKDFTEPGLSEEDQAKLEAYEAEQKAWDEEDYPFICEMVAMMNDQAWVDNHDMEQIVKEFNTNPYRGFYGIPMGLIATIPVRPDVSEIDENSPEYQEYLGKLAVYEAEYAKYQEALKEYDRRKEANVLQPGDIRKFEIYLTSDSQHVYKYKDGSFTLATPSWENVPDNKKGVEGFDGQVLSEGYVSKEISYTISGGFRPLKELIIEASIGPLENKYAKKEREKYSEEELSKKEVIAEIEKTAKKSASDRANQLFSFYHSLDGLLEGFESVLEENCPEAKTEMLRLLNCSEDNLYDGFVNYILDYYSTEDNKYSSLDELFEKCAIAREDLSSTTNSNLEPWTFGKEKKEISVKLEQNFEYNNFYMSLLSFVYREDNDGLEKITGVQDQKNTNGTFGYEHESWTFDERYQYALEYYMSHKAAWDEANEFFKELLKKGLSEKDAAGAAFAMAINLDGELTNNSYQLTKWPWYNSIQVERMDIDFSLTKTNEDGEIITSSETEFQIYYIDTVIDENGESKEVKMYCTQTEEDGIVSYTFVPTESTVWTEKGELNIPYIMMKDIVYYLKEKTAPEGYNLDPNVYVIMSEDDYTRLSDEDKAALEGTYYNPQLSDENKAAWVYNQLSDEDKAVLEDRYYNQLSDEDKVAMEDKYFNQLSDEDKEAWKKGTLNKDQFLKYILKDILKDMWNDELIFKNDGLSISINFVNRTPNPTSTPTSTPSPTPTPEVTPPPTPTPTPEVTPPPTPTPTPGVTPPPTPTPTPGVTPPPTVPDIPDDPVPFTDIPEPPVPLAERPVTVELPDEDVPLAGAPELVDIFDEDVPLAAVPETGDISVLWYVLVFSSAAGLLALRVADSKKRKIH